MKKTVQFSILISFLLLICVEAMAQTGSVSGVVRDVKTGQVLPGATAATGPSSGVATDADGKFKLTAPAGELKIEFR